MALQGLTFSLKTLVRMVESRQIFSRSVLHHYLIKDAIRDEKRVGLLWNTSAHSEPVRWRGSGTLLASTRTKYGWQTNGWGHHQAHPERTTPRRPKISNTPPFFTVQSIKDGDQILWPVQATCDGITSRASFTYGANEPGNEDISTRTLTRQLWERIMKDYNETFSTNFWRIISTAILRMFLSASRKACPAKDWHPLIVVDMFLDGLWQ